MEGPWGSVGEGGGGARESRGTELGMSHRAGGTGPCGPQLGLTGCRGQSSCLALEEVSLRPGGSWAPEQLLTLQPHVLLWPTGQGWVPAPVCPSAEGPCAVHNIPNCTRVVESQGTWPAAHKAELQLVRHRKAAESWWHPVPPAAQAQDTGSHLAMRAEGKPRAESTVQLTERSWASGFVTSIARESMYTSRETSDLRLGGNTGRERERRGTPLGTRAEGERDGARPWEHGQRARETGHAPGLHSAPVTPSMRPPLQTTPSSIVEQDKRQK